MMKAMKIAVIFSAVAACLLLAGCQSEAAQLVDQQISSLISQDVSLGVGEKIQALEEQIKSLSEKEYDSLKNSAAFQEFCDKYQEMEDRAVEEIETLISELPAPDELKLASDEVIRKAESAYNKTSDFVKERIRNAEALTALRAEMDDYKESCWVKCTNCGGDGRVTCSLCSGSGSRKVYHTTPNGKRWLVSQDCATSKSCGSCSGYGGAYEEP